MNSILKVNGTVKVNKREYRASWMLKNDRSTRAISCSVEYDLVFYNDDSGIKLGSERPAIVGVRVVSLVFWSG